jgi:UDP-N-acetylmuramate--alanine ligase
VHQAVRELYPEHKSTRRFSAPFSRTSDFADSRKVYLILMILLMDIYPRELLWKVFVRMVVVKMENKNKKLVVKENVIESILASDAR